MSQSNSVIVHGNPRVLTREEVESLVFEECTPETILALSELLDQLESDLQAAELKGAEKMLILIGGRFDIPEGELLEEYKKQKEQSDE